MTRLRLAALAGLLLLAGGMLQAQNSGGPQLRGTWKLTLPTLRSTEGNPVVLLKVSASKDRWSAEVVKSGFAGKTELENFTVTATRIRFTLKGGDTVLACALLLPKKSDATKLRGQALDHRRTIVPVEMERTTLTSLDKYSLDRERLANEPDGWGAVVLAKMLLSAVAEKQVEVAEARAWADRAVKSAELYGRAITRETLLDISEMLSQQRGFEKTALAYARQAERDLDERTESPQVLKRVWDGVIFALERSGNKEAVAPYQAKIAKLDFRPKLIKFAGRKVKSDRVVLAEVFTGSQARSCVAADMAVEALTKTFGAKELAIICYQQHIPTGDPLSSPDSEERLLFYERDIRALPGVLLNGKVSVPGGGGQEEAQDCYDRYADEIEPLLETQAKAQLSLKATQQKEKITIAVEANDLKATGEKVRLRVVLVEAETTYQGESGRKVHLNVARAMPGGHDGTQMKEKSFKKSFTVDLAELKKSLTKYQELADKKKTFPSKERPLDLKSLRVIAFIQNDANLEVLQAAQVDVK